METMETKEESMMMDIGEVGQKEVGQEDYLKDEKATNLEEKAKEKTKNIREKKKVNL